MIQRLSHTTLYVLDQDSARDFYVNKLGFEVRMDGKMDNGFRWLTVSPKGQPDLQIILMQGRAKHAARSGEDHSRLTDTRQNQRRRAANQRLPEDVRGTQSQGS
jgi:catechol 2,3-dioxygenase-like lactoylglutathione lyase family enzyme